MLYITRNDQQIVRNSFVRVPSDGEHYRCKRCGAYLSDVKTFPLLVKYRLLLEHLKECANGIHKKC